MSSDSPSEDLTYLTESLLLSREYHSISPDENISHKLTGMKSHLKFSDDSHRMKHWSEDMLFFYANMILDKYALEKKLKYGLFRNENDYGPRANDTQVSFHPFKWFDQWNLAICFPTYKKVVIIYCANDNVHRFSSRIILRTDKFIVHFGHKMKKSAYTNPYLISNIIEPVCPINAINILALIYSFCQYPELLVGTFVDKAFTPTLFDVSEFYQDINEFDRFGNAREVLGNPIIEKMMLESRKRPILEIEPQQTTPSQTTEQPPSKKVKSANKIANNTSSIATIANGHTILEGSNNEVTTDTTLTASSAKDNSAEITHVQEEKPIEESQLFPKKTAIDFIKEITSDLEDVPQDIDVFDEVIEMMESWSHPQSSQNEDRYKTWTLLVREVLVSNYTRKTRLEFDEDECKEILKTGNHNNQVFPLILESGVVYLVNIRTDHELTTANVLEISGKSSKSDKDIYKSHSVRRLIEMYGWEHKKLIHKIKVARYTVRDGSMYNILIAFLYHIHWFIVHGKFSLNVKTNFNKIDNYGIILQRMMYDVQDGNVKSRNVNYKKLLSCL